MPNRLANELSPYLLQHADNPVDWWPWCDEAFAEARRRNLPIFLSIGYSTCHWCHQMAHESFENEAVAAVLNENFVSIKVDREVLPDIDDIYMTAVQLSSGRGGWPMTVFLDHDRRPFFAGTYFPPERRGQVPSFSDLCRQISEAWNHVRDEVELACEQFEKALRENRSAELEPFSGDLTAELLHDCARDLEDEFDSEFGGFGNAPKFPPHTALEFLATYAQRPDCLVDTSAHMVRATLRPMILGGIHDLVNGGFHRYSTDVEWLLPHFEKMLTDNGQMLTNLAQALAISDGEDAQLIRLAADGIMRWLEADMISPEGTFYSAMNADSEGREGAYYVWRSQEIADSEFAEAYGVIPMGNFLDEATRQRTGENILVWSREDSPVVDGQWRFAAQLEALRIQNHRPKPSTDTKVIASSNGLMIRGLADWAAATGDRRAKGLARTALKPWINLNQVPHALNVLEPMGAAYLDDVAYLGLAAFTCTQLTDDPNVAQFAARCAEQLQDFPNFAFTSAAHDNRFGPAFKPLDQAVPSPIAVALRLQLRHGTANPADLMRYSGWMHRAPQATEALHLALHEFLTSGTRP